MAVAASPSAFFFASRLLSITAAAAASASEPTSSMGCLGHAEENGEKGAAAVVCCTEGSFLPLASAAWGFVRAAATAIFIISGGSIFSCLKEPRHNRVRLYWIVLR